MVKIVHNSNIKLLEIQIKQLGICGWKMNANNVCSLTIQSEEF